MNLQQGEREHDQLVVCTVSELAQQTELPQVPPISEDGLTQLERVMRYGLAMHNALGIAPQECALPLHIHPITILSLVQEISHGRDTK